MIAEGHTRQVGILVFDEVEVLDMAGPFEVFSVASRLMLRQRPAEPPPFGVALVSAGGQAVLARRYPAVRVVGDRRWVDHGRIATSGGISAGIDLSLHLVGRFLGIGHARATAHQMEYDWRESPG